MHCFVFQFSLSSFLAVGFILLYTASLVAIALSDSKVGSYVNNLNKIIHIHVMQIINKEGVGGGRMAFYSKHPFTCKTGVWYSGLPK